MLTNRIMCLLGVSLLFNTCNINTQTPLWKATEVVKNENNGIKQVHDLQLKNFMEQYEKQKLENEKKDKEAKRQKELEEQKKNDIEWQDFIVSFYTGLEEENSIHGNVDCKGKPLERGVIANNVLPLGTKIFLDNEYGIRTVSDKGGSNFNSSNRIDLYVARWDGETREQWKKRANSYGVKTIRGYIVK